MVLDNTEMVATWRESDWAVSSIHYAKLIQLIEAKNYDGAVAQACQSIAKDLKNIREIANVSNARQGPRIPKISEQVHESSCK